MSFSKIGNDVASGPHIIIEKGDTWERHLYVWFDQAVTQSTCSVLVDAEYIDAPNHSITLAPNIQAKGHDRYSETSESEKMFVKRQCAGDSGWQNVAVTDLQYQAGIDLGIFKMDYWRVRVNDQHSVRIVIVIENHNSGEG